MLDEAAKAPTPPLVGEHGTLADAFAAARAQHGDRVAYVEGDRRLTFADWDRAADGLAGELVDRGVRPGDVVAIMLPASIDYAIATAAITKAGGVVTGLNLRLGRSEIRAVLERVAPSIVIVDTDTTWLPSGFAVLERSALEPSAARVGVGRDAPRRHPADPAVIIWTSGTTGVPKGAWFDHRNLRAAVASAGVMSHPFDRKLVGLPFAHAGYAAKVWDQLAWVTTIVIGPNPWTAESMLQQLVDERITVAAGVPTQWAKLLDLPAVKDADLSSLRLGLVATAPASPELIERVVRTIGCPLIVRYAMTESPSITGTDPADPPDVQCRTVGRPQRGMEVEVVEEDGRAAPAGTVGRVRVRGDCVMRGYWGEPELTARAVGADGWLTSSDLGWFDDAGNLVLAGRADDMYIRGGYNVYPVEVEDVLAAHPSVEQAAVVGVRAPVIGEVGVAFVVPLEPDDPPTLAGLRQWVRDRLADYKAPDHLVVLDALPLTSMLKVDKAELRRRLKKRDGTDEAASGAGRPGRFQA